MGEIRLTRDGARALALAAQGLDARPRKRATKADVLAAIRRMGALQIDTIHVVARSPYLVLWSRLGPYDPRWLDELLAEGALFEYWAHEACFLPTERFPLFRHRMLDVRSMKWKYSQAAMERRDEVERLLGTIRERGPVRSADFERTDGKGGGWWEWKPEKRLLESLFTAGELMIARRERFQRVYDLRERVLPGWDDARLPPREAADRALVLDAVRALGVAKARWVADYFRMPKRGTPALPARLAEEGALLRVRVEGWSEPGYVHPDHRGTAERAAAGELRPRRTTLLSPFDPLVWDRGRASDLWGFDYRLECYTPAPKRRWGYFVLPVLRRGELVARLDPKAHRREGVFEVRSLYLEPGVRATAALVDDLARALRECAAWHETPEVAVRASDPPELAARLRGALAA
ncbi:MAG TPA: crosslink repair DNA glycosylase YcaQ family protein [Longimicrobiaceae bacterium]|nr:crosslink repair DNA glycosylase YcaQ family protein [Longimicrobiaceae bacterium]